MTIAASSTVPTAELAAALRDTIMRFTRRLRRERPDHGLSLTQLSALASLHNLGPMTPRELADCERVRPPSMTKILGALELIGLIRRDPHPSDGRQLVITATEDGSELILQNRRLREAWLATQLDRLSDAQRATLADAVVILSRLAST
jgi:DNA-binding MarR family transcriptional regulator